MLVPNPSLSCRCYEVPVDYINSAAGEVRLVVVEYQAIVSNKRGPLLVCLGAGGGVIVDQVDPRRRGYAV